MNCDWKLIRYISRRNLTKRLDSSLSNRTNKNINTLLVVRRIEFGIN